MTAVSILFAGLFWGAICLYEYSIENYVVMFIFLLFGAFLFWATAVAGHEMKKSKQETPIRPVTESM